MRSKKSTSADLNKKSSFYLAIGLFLVLFISWRAIEWKNYDDDGYGYVALDVDDDDDEFSLLLSNQAVEEVIYEVNVDVYYSRNDDVSLCDDSSSCFV